METRGEMTAESEDRLGMTEEQWARFQAYTRGFGEQDENGVDVSLLRENLRRTPEERVRRGLLVFEERADYHTTLNEAQFERILQALAASGARVVLIGGLAMRAHGSAHLTEDVDFCYARDRENLAAVVEALAPLDPHLRGAPADLPFRWDALTLRNGLNFTLATEAGAVDLLGHAAGVDSFEGLWQRGREVTLFGVSLRVASLDDLIAMKRAAGRAKDQAHLMELERLRALLAEEKPEP